MGHLHLLLDEMGLDKMGLDEMGINPCIHTSMYKPIITYTYSCSHNTHNTHTCTGIRGEVRVRVNVEMIKDQHRFKQSSCGVQFEPPVLCM